MDDRIFSGIKIIKKESEFIKFLLTGSNAFQEAFYLYEARRLNMRRNLQTNASWFNNTLEGLHNKKLCEEISYVLKHPSGYIWSNPGIRANRANYLALTLVEDKRLTEYELNKII